MLIRLKMKTRREVRAMIVSVKMVAVATVLTVKGVDL
jgi:hypothetical protein